MLHSTEPEKLGNKKYQGKTFRSPWEEILWMDWGQVGWGYKMRDQVRGSTKGNGCKVGQHFGVRQKRCARETYFHWLFEENRLTS